MTFDPEADAAYIHLTDEELMPGRDSVPVDPPEGLRGTNGYPGQAPSRLVAQV